MNRCSLREHDTFENTFRQNFGHIQTLSSILELYKTNIHTISAFVGQCEVKTLSRLPDSLCLSASEVCRYIERFTERCFSTLAIRALVNTFEATASTTHPRTENTTSSVCGCVNPCLIQAVDTGSRQRILPSPPEDRRVGQYAVAHNSRQRRGNQSTTDPQAG